MKTREEKLIQVKRIMKKLEKRGQNCESINEVYRGLLDSEVRYVGGCDPSTESTESCHMVIWDTATGAMYPVDPLKHPGNVLKDPDFKPNNI